MRQIFEIATTAPAVLKPPCRRYRRKGYRTKEWTSRCGRHHPAAVQPDDTPPLALQRTLYGCGVAQGGAICQASTRPSSSEAGMAASERAASAQQRLSETHELTRKRHSAAGAPAECGRAVDRCVQRTRRRHGPSLPILRLCGSTGQRAASAGEAGRRTSISKRLCCGHLEPVLGSGLSSPLVHQALERVVYDGSDPKRIACDCVTERNRSTSYAEPAAAGRRAAAVRTDRHACPGSAG